MLDDVRRHVMACKVCQSMKPSNQVPAGEGQFQADAGRASVWTLSQASPRPSEGAPRLLLCDRLTEMAQYMPSGDTLSAQEFPAMLWGQV